MMNIVIICNDCQQYNKQNLGTDGFEFRDTKFTAFSDAYNHMKDNPDHWMSMEVREESEDD